MNHLTADTVLFVFAGGSDGVAGVLSAMNLTEWLGLETYLVVATVVLVGVAGWWRWQVRQRSRSDAASPPELPEGAGDRSAGKESIERPSTATADSGVMRQPALGESAAEEAFFTSEGEMPARQCPECERTFPGAFDVCPFDSSPLRPGGATTRKSGDQLPRRYCRHCERRYELNAAHCYHDGHELHRDTDRASANATTYYVCRSCGFETPDDGCEECPRDGESLIELDPTARRRVKPAFPYNRCRQCGHIASPDETKCPVDGSLLLPALSARLTALPPTGYGERRRICPECGTRFGDQCTHCSVDGTELVELN